MKRKKKASNTVPIPMRPKGLQWVECKVCFEDGAYCSPDVKAVTCSTCVAKMAAPPEQPKMLQNKPEEKRPKGWHFMTEYISPSGKIYHKGKEVNESNEPDVPVVRTPRKTKKASDSTGSAGNTRKRANRTIRGGKPAPTGRKRGRPKKQR